MIETRKIVNSRRQSIVTLSRKMLEASGLALNDSVVVESQLGVVIITREDVWQKRSKAQSTK